MGLYFRIAVITVLSLSLFFIIAELTSGTQTLQSASDDGLTNIKSQDLDDELLSSFSYGNQTSGKELKELIQNSASYKIAVFVESTNGSVTNYGLQLRSELNSGTAIQPYFAEENEPSAFHKYYTTYVKHFIGGTNAVTDFSLTNFSNLDSFITAGNKTDSSKAFAVTPLFPNQDSNYYFLEKALYTDMKLRYETANTNLTYMNNIGSEYYVPDDLYFASVPVLNRNEELVGLVFEPSNQPDKYSIFKSLFKY